MFLRTDLAIETINAEKIAENGVKVEEERHGKIIKTRQKTVENEYITFSLPPLMLYGEACREAEMLLSQSITALLPKKRNYVLVVGLGNTDITPDALGPLSAKRVLATRHIGKELAVQLNLGNLKSVAVLSPGVLGQTGIEAAELILSVCKKTNPDAVIVIDALCAGSTERLGCTVQLTDAGISPGSGVKNSRAKIDSEYLGVPVIAVGMPTVIDIGKQKTEAEFLVTPKDIDLLIDRAATLLGNAINFSLQPDIEPDYLISLV